MRAIFLDKDGTLIDDVRGNVSPELIRLTGNAGRALQLFQLLGYSLFVVTNQAGIARGYFTETSLASVHERLDELLAQYDVSLDGFYYCPHSPDGTIRRYASGCECRKPMPGLLERAAREHRIDLGQSWMIGDIPDQVEAGRRAGCNTVLIDSGNETGWVNEDPHAAHLVAPDLYAAAKAIALAGMAAHPLHHRQALRP